MHLVIVDIDKTISDFSHREALLPKSGVKADQKAWDLFISEEMCFKDPPVEGAHEALKKMQEAGAVVVFLTGRNKGLLDVTKRWMKEKFNWKVSLGRNLFMRPKKCLDAPTVYKEKQLKAIIEGFEAEMDDCDDLVITAIDDDDYTLNRLYPKYCHMVLKAPECWKVLFPVNPDLGEEQAWRK